jgi:hypothetical protein
MATLPEMARLLAEAIRARGITLPQRFSVELGEGAAIDILVEDSSARVVGEGNELRGADSGDSLVSKRRESGVAPARSSMIVPLAKSGRPEPLSEPSSRIRQHDHLSLPPEEELA